MTALIKIFLCWDQLLCKCFGQATFRDSLRYLTSTFNASASRRFNMGIETNLQLSNLSSINVNHSRQIYNDRGMILIAHDQILYGNNELTESLKTLDLSTIDMCLLLFPWAEFTMHKEANKIHANYGPEEFYTDFYSNI